jgi:hypothetical protein
MANTLENFIREVWAPEIQENATKSLVAMQICDVVELQDGDTYNNPYASDPTVGTYTRNPSSNGATTSDIASTNEQLTIGTAKYAGFKVDRLDEKQMMYRLNGFMKKRSQYKLRDAIDVAILAEYSNALSTVDGGDIGQTDGQGVNLGASVGAVMDAILAGEAKLAEQSVDNNGDLFLVMHPTDFITYAKKYLIANGFRLADDVMQNGYKGTLDGIDIYTSLNVATSVVSNHNVRHWLMGKKGAISFGKMAGDLVNLEVIQNPKLSDGTTFLGTEYILWNLYGKKTFTEGARELVDIQVRY